VSIPNLITFGRLLAVPLAVYLILQRELDYAFWLFIAAGISDALDGAIARMFRSRTVLGAYLDPLADKALLVSVYLSLASIAEVPLWLVILIVFRDLMIVAGVLLLYTLKESLAMQPLGISKLNTAIQIALAAAVLAPPGFGLREPWLFGTDVVDALVWLCALSTFGSGLAYVMRSRLLFNRHGGVA
jgi:cardiolipin synthase (CMP-forming)